MSRSHSQGIAGLVAALCCFVGSFPALGGTPIDVYVLSGQSNMVGSGWVGGAIAQGDEHLIRQKDVLYHFNITQSPPAPADVVADEWGPLRELGGVGHSFGLELSFGRTIADASDTPVAIIKTCVNGAAIRYFLPSGDYGDRLGSYVDGVVAQLAAMGYEPTIRALVWVQGSSDAASEEHHALYNRRMQDLIQYVRVRWGRSLTIVQAQQYCCGPYPQNQIDVIRRVKESLTVKDANITLTNTDDLTMRSEMIHYDWQSLIVLGERLASDYLAHTPADINSDGAVDTADLGIMIGAFGETGLHRADLNGDRTIDTADLGQLIASFGSN